MQTLKKTGGLKECAQNLKMLIDLANTVKADRADKGIELIEKISAKAFSEKSPNLMYNYTMVLRYALSGCSFGVMVSRIMDFIGFKESQDRMARCLDFLNSTSEKTDAITEVKSQNI